MFFQLSGGFKINIYRLVVSVCDVSQGYNKYPGPLRDTNLQQHLNCGWISTRTRAHTHTLGLRLSVYQYTARVRILRSFFLTLSQSRCRNIDLNQVQAPTFSCSLVPPHAPTLHIIRVFLLDKTSAKSFSQLMCKKPPQKLKIQCTPTRMVKFKCIGPLILVNLKQSDIQVCIDHAKLHCCAPLLFDVKGDVKTTMEERGFGLDHGGFVFRINCQTGKSNKSPGQSKG